MNTVFLEILRRFCFKVLMYVLKIGKDTIDDVSEYMQRIETFHKKFSQALTSGSYNISEDLSKDFKDYECENFKLMWELLREAKPISTVKRDMVAKFAHVNYGISEKYINLIIELLILVSSI